MNTKSFQMLISLGAAICLWGVLVIGTQIFSGAEGFCRFLELLGGSPNGYIHVFIYTAFVYGLLELRENHRYIKGQYDGFNLNLLPTEDQRIISPDEVGKIKISAIHLEKRGFNFLLADFIKKACTQYRNDQNISETLQVFEAQVDNNKGELEGNLEMVRYTIGAVVSFGFIGTLLGLSSAIGQSHLAQTEGGMPEVTNLLNVAFDTTLVALVAGLVLNFLYHRYLEDLDTFYSRTKSYVIENLISRIYARPSL